MQVSELLIKEHRLLCYYLCLGVYNFVLIKVNLYTETQIADEFTHLLVLQKTGVGEGQEGLLKLYLKITCFLPVSSCSSVGKNCQCIKKTKPPQNQNKKSPPKNQKPTPLPLQSPQNYVLFTVWNLNCLLCFINALWN